MNRKRLLKKLWAMARSVWKEEANIILHDRAYVMFKKESLKELNEWELEQMIEWIKQDMEQEEKRRKKRGAPTFKQEWLIWKLGRKLFTDERHFRRWLEKWWGVSHPAWLTRREARDVIHALMMIEKKREDRHAQA